MSQTERVIELISFELKKTIVLFPIIARLFVLTIAIAQIPLFEFNSNLFILEIVVLSQYP